VVQTFLSAQWQAGMPAPHFFQPLENIAAVRPETLPHGDYKLESFSEPAAACADDDA